ncbi:MAG TPA: PQQ-dependent sugar dehydrogenase [Pyrinomonadaceae bacterium]|nr:PQQ-dependent sugar dehydrogenase [Pyrinomonadaceae bacterium]
MSRRCGVSEIPLPQRRLQTQLPLAITFLLFLFACMPVNAATLLTGFSETQVAGGISNPTAMDFAPDGRLFVCQQTGQLRVIKNGALLATPFVTLTVDSSVERGLLGIAFDPNFATNNFLYVYYTVPGSPAHNRVSRFTANGDVAVAGSEFVVVDLDNLSGAGNHNGGAIHFGPDAKLYIAVGDNANAANSQTLGIRLGKILRLNPDATIPGDNPFFNTATGANRSIWAMGLRNPFTFAFQPGTGRLFINDVGETTWEEINDGIAGSNYGWNICEGACSPPNANFRDPLFQYGHGSTATTGCAIVGGGFYNPATAQFGPAFVGKYFFADLCTGWIRLFDPATGTASGFATGINAPVDLKVGSDGSLYYLTTGAAAVFRIQFNGTAPTITAQPNNQTVTQGQPATFGVAASGSPTLAYQWQRNQVNIGGATSPNYTTPATTAADNGAKFRCVVTNPFGSATSNEVTLTVQPPPPALAMEDGSDSAIALDSVTLFRDPFPLTNAFNLSTDNRTRIMLFATNLTLGPGENASAVTAQAVDAQMNIYPMTVEFVGALPAVNSFTEVVVLLPSNLPGGQSVLISLTWHSLTTNQVRIRIK